MPNLNYITLEEVESLKSLLQFLKLQLSHCSCKREQYLLKAEIVDIINEINLITANS